MGTDLVSVCVFCASLLLRTELNPPRGLSAEIGGAYSTINRKINTAPDPLDFSSVTPKFVLIGLRQAWPVPGDLGAGTPAREWRARIALGPSHNDQTQPPGGPGKTSAAGTGRYENIAILYRQPVGAADSIEAGWVRHKNASTDAVNLGSSNYVLGEQRVLGASRDDWGLDWRHRFRGLEVALSGRMTHLDAGNATAAFSGGYGGNIYGGGAEVRWRMGAFTLQAHGEALSGSLDVGEQSFPAFVSRVYTAPASLRCFSASAAYAWPNTDIVLSYSYDRNRLPFVTFGVLGVEQTAFDSGFQADARLGLSSAELKVRTRIGPGIRVYAAVRAFLGDETVVLTDSAGVAPARTLHVRWAQVGNTQTLSGSTPGRVFMVGAEFTIGRSGPP
ncbi:MAG: hypothetical protein ACRD1B_01935 [Thermoanaerobaculia bacterium]